MKLKNKIKNFIFSKRTYEKDYRIYDEIIILGIKFKRKIKDLNEQFNTKYVIKPDIFMFEQCQDSIKEYLQSEKFIENYCNLIKNLDEQSCEIINNIISRYKSYMETGNTLFTLTKNEQQQLEKYQYFCQEILNIGANIQAYKQYLLKDYFFAFDVWGPKYFINEFSNIKKDKSIIDVGACVGDSALLLKDYTDKKVYAFEPFNNNIQKLKINIELNKASNIEIVDKALSDSTQIEQTIYADGPMASIAQVRERHKKIKTTIETIKLDDWIKANPVDIGLIKVDIEGAEQNFLKGAFNTIKEQKPNMIISIYHSGSDFFKIKPLIESWDLGYTFKVRRCHPHYISGETVLLCEVK